MVQKEAHNAVPPRVNRIRPIRSLFSQDKADQFFFGCFWRHNDAKSSTYLKELREVASIEELIV
jgi:hypothetical protein